MKKLLFLLSIFFISFNINAQLVLKLSSVTANKGDNISIELRTDNFTKIQSSQYSIAYDTMLMQYIDLSNFAPGYEDIAYTEQPGKKGKINTSWNNPNGESNSYPNNTLLFKINF
ncbi:MAG: cohesin domain-containing protein, partial [Saprospiraceae bacterium]